MFENSILSQHISLDVFIRWKIVCHITNASNLISHLPIVSGKCKWSFVRCINEEFFTLFQCKTIPMSLTFSPDGKMFATLATDRKVGQYSMIVCE